MCSLDSICHAENQHARFVRIVLHSVLLIHGVTSNCHGLNVHNAHQQLKRLNFKHN